MAKLIIVLCALVACVAAKPGVQVAAQYAAAPFATAAYTAPFTYSTPLAYSSAFIAPGGSSRVDIQKNYNTAYVAAPYAYAPQAVAAPARISALSYPTTSARLLSPYTFAAPAAAYSTPYAYSAPYAYASPYTYSAQYAYASPVSSATSVSTSAAAAASPLKYSAAPVLF